jgi:hypothetical protein
MKTSIQYWEEIEGMFDETFPDDENVCTKWSKETGCTHHNIDEIANFFKPHFISLQHRIKELEEENKKKYICGIEKGKIDGLKLAHDIVSNCSDERDAEEEIQQLLSLNS